MGNIENETTGANTAMNKQEFILNNITEMVRAGRVADLPKLAADLAEVYDISMAMTPSTLGFKIQVDTEEATDKLNELAQVAEQVDVSVSVTDVPSIPHESTEPTPIADVPTEPTPPAERTHDDWGLPFSDDWHVSTRNTAKPGYFKRKPGTNEEQYAAFIQKCVDEAIAAGTFTGPDNWATVSRLGKYLDPVQAAPTSPQVTDTETLQPQAETVGQAMHTGAVAEAPTAPTPSVEAAPTAPVGASAASEVPAMDVMMKAHMSVCQGFGVNDTRHKAVLERLDAANIMMIKDDKKAWFVAASNAVAEQLETIKADPSGEMLKMVLDTVTT